MKTIIRWFILLIITCSIGILSYKITVKAKHKKEIAERIKNVPNFSFYTLEGTIFTEKNLEKKPIIFVYFNSECDYCKSEAVKIQKHLDDFKNVQLIFISYEETKVIKEFIITYKLDNKENVIFLEDKKGEFSKIFDAKTIPYIVIYDENKKLLKKIKGVTKIDEILYALE